ncbi:iron-containing alcohol dehydrogenase, partial [Neisseria gonorrhoeae]|uniref:iron-containing alcohol dehydrogenase n=1 Tax=Neisseria gonorrhoeae TaxID=485 RepID=UPI0021C0A3AC
MTVLTWLCSGAAVTFLLEINFYVFFFVFQNSGADYLIAIGGGSPQDTCKAIGIISNNPEFADVRSLEGLSPT